MGKSSEVNVIEAETFIYYLLLTLVGWTVVLALKALGNQFPRMRKGLWRELWKAPMAASALLGFLSWVTLVEFLHAREPFFTGIPAAMIYVGWFAYLTVHVYRLADSGGEKGPPASA